MSQRALTLAARNQLRTNLTNFYNNTDAGLQVTNRAANCRVMPNHCPAPNCGQEFIAVYGSVHRPRESWIETAVEEQFAIEVAISLRTPFLSRDQRGELAYVYDENLYLAGWKTIEARCREIVGLLDKNYVFMRTADALFENENGFTEPLYWVGSDAAPQEVGAEHFCAYHAAANPAGGRDTVSLPGAPEADDVYGLLMHVRFDGAIRLQPKTEYDVAY